MDPNLMIFAKGECCGKQVPSDGVINKSWKATQKKKIKIKENHISRNEASR